MHLQTRPRNGTDWYHLRKFRVPIGTASREVGMTSNIRRPATTSRRLATTQSRRSRKCRRLPHGRQQLRQTQQRYFSANLSPLPFPLLRVAGVVAWRCEGRHRCEGIRRRNRAGSAGSIPTGSRPVSRAPIRRRIRSIRTLGGCRPCSVCAARLVDVPQWRGALWQPVVRDDRAADPLGHHCERRCARTTDSHRRRPERLSGLQAIVRVQSTVRTAALT